MPPTPPHHGLEQPEHDGDTLGDFAETIIDADGEVEPELLEEPEEGEIAK